VAAIPSSDGTITACRDNKTGLLRVIDTADMLQGCSGKETRLHWKDGITGKVADSDKLDNKDSTEFLGANQKAADSDNLDGKSGEDFYAVGSKVADSAHADSATSAGDADTLDGLDSTELGAASAVKVGQLELPKPPPGGQPNTGTVFETDAFEIQGQCMNSSFPLPNAPQGRLLLVAKQRTLAITYSPPQSTALSEVDLPSGKSVEFAETEVTPGSAGERITYGSYFADAITSGDFLQGHGTLSILSNPSGSGESCRFSTTGLGQ
jgi:hypothetical protein